MSKLTTLLTGVLAIALDLAFIQPASSQTIPCGPYQPPTGSWASGGIPGPLYTSCSHHPPRLGVRKVRIHNYTDTDIAVVCAGATPDTYFVLSLKNGASAIKHNVTPATRGIVVLDDFTNKVIKTGSFQFETDNDPDITVKKAGTEYEISVTPNSGGK